jgi:hypothetical protein
LKEETLDLTVWRTRFGRDYGLFARQTKQWRNEGQKRRQNWTDLNPKDGYPIRQALYSGNAILSCWNGVACSFGLFIGNITDVIRRRFIWGSEDSKVLKYYAAWTGKYLPVETGITSQKTWSSSNTAVRAANLAISWLVYMSLLFRYGC